MPERAFPSGSVWIALGILLTIVSGQARAQTPPAENSVGALDAFSNAVESMVRRVSPSVVQILVTRYGGPEPTGRANAMVGWQHSIGSGVIVAPDGYIVTNAHVVAKAEQIRVRLVPAGTQTIGGVLAESFAQPINATLVGSFAEADLALLKIAASGLPALPIAGSGRLRQGQVVFAFGSPEGLQNSVSMGVVSSIARQLDPDSPMLYIQTDAPINPGNSGGPLVNAAGEMVGVDTFISTQSGGNEGIGFALPGVLVHWVVEQLRQYGHVHRPVIGAGLQTITPLLAAALKLPRSSGVLVSDLQPGSPAAAAGLKLNDVLLNVDGRALDNVAAMIGLSFQHVPGDAMKIQVMRGDQTLSFDVIPVDVQEPTERLSDLSDLSKSVIPRLGIMAVTLDERTASAVGSVRLTSGAIVVARTIELRSADTSLQAGDIVHEINGKSVFSVDDLRAAVAGLKSGDPVAIQVERAGQWSYVAFEMP
jgi:serine protease Do